MISRESTSRPASRPYRQKWQVSVFLLATFPWALLYLLIASKIYFRGDDIGLVPKNLNESIIGGNCGEGMIANSRSQASFSIDAFPRDFSIYLASVPYPGEWPFPLNMPAYLEEDDPSNTSRNITITTCVPVMTRQIDVEANLPTVLESIQKQTSMADEVAVVISDVDKLRKQWKSQGGESGWCSFLMELIRAYIPGVPRVRVACIGGRLTAGWARNILARLATSEILSFIDADDEEYSVRNEVTRNMFECYRDQLSLLLHSASNDRFMNKYEVLQAYREDEKGVPRYGVRPGDRCADDELVRPRLGPPLVTYGDKLFDRIWVTFDKWVLGGGVAHGHMIVHKRVFRHVKFSVLAKGEDAMFARDIIMTFGRRKYAFIFLSRPLTWYRRPGNVNQDLLRASSNNTIL